MIVNMSENKFKHNVKLTMEMFQDKHKTLEDEHSWIWNLISSGFYEFNIRKFYDINIFLILKNSFYNNILYKNTL